LTKNANLMLPKHVLPLRRRMILTTMCTRGYVIVINGTTMQVLKHCV